MRLIDNIITKPTETKYRTIKTTIPKIQNTIFSLDGGVSELILAFGFVQTDAEHFVFVGDYLKVLQKGQALTEKALGPVKYKFMTPEEKKKYDLLQEQKAIYKAEQEKQRAAKEQLQKQREWDAKEKAQNKATASKANPNLKGFGQGEKGVFKAPEPRKGG